MHHVPRHARRGLSALAMMLLISTVVGSVLVSWQVTQARAALEGRAQVFVEIVDARALALHHWLHAARDAPGFTNPATGMARQLSSVETRALADHPSSAPWLGRLRGWQIVPLVAMPHGQHGVPVPHGIIVLRPDPAAPPDPRDILAVRTAIDNQASAAARILAATDLSLDPQDLAVFAWSYADLDDRFVLRSRRAGHAPPLMRGDLDLEGNALEGVGALEEVGALDVAGDLGVANLTATGSGDIRDSLTLDHETVRAWIDTDRWDAQGPFTVATGVFDDLETGDLAVRGDATIQSRQ